MHPSLLRKEEIQSAELEIFKAVCVCVCAERFIGFHGNILYMVVSDAASSCDMVDILL